jgi:hypothetical protein
MAVAVVALLVVVMRLARPLRVPRLRPLSARLRHRSQRPATLTTWTTTFRFNLHLRLFAFASPNPWLTPRVF